jgi:CRP/FNR family cyclic AMP-dependent transcriptional regulator
MIVKEIELFKGIEHAVMNQIANICSEENYSKDVVLFKKGEKAESLYILEEGSVNLVIENGGTITYILKEPGQVFGWSSMVESGKYTASGVCAADLKVLKIERDKLDKIFNQYPEAGLKILKRLAAVISQRLTNAYNDLLSARRQDITPSYG